MSQKTSRFSFDRIDRRVIYVFIALSLALPLIAGYSLTPAPMETAQSFYDQVESLKHEEGKIVLIAADWGPSTKAENEPQTEAAIEHLMRRRIPFALISNLPYATPFLKRMPRKIAAVLEKETGEQWNYGKDWVNLGYQPGMLIMIQGFAKASDIHKFFKTDTNGTPLSDIPAMKGVKTIKSIPLLIEVTGSVGVFNVWLQFFQSEGYKPPYIHGCTSVSIPDAYNYYVSKQIVGLHEGIAGASYYDKLLSKNYPKRKPGKALRIMTGISVAHLLIIGFIIVGNISEIKSFLQRRGERK